MTLTKEEQDTIRLASIYGDLASLALPDRVDPGHFNTNLSTRRKH